MSTVLPQNVPHIICTATEALQLRSVARVPLEHGAGRADFPALI
jgi:hypothetical protein